MIYESYMIERGNLLRPPPLLDSGWLKPSEANASLSLLLSLVEPESLGTPQEVKPEVRLPSSRVLEEVLFGPLKLLKEFLGGGASFHLRWLG